MDINYQFECLSQSLRMQLEQINKYPELVKVDEHEAIFNVEIIVKSVLDCFHNVFDAIQTLSNKTIDFYQYPELHLIIQVRNARHHNDTLTSIFFENDEVFFVDFSFEEDSLPCLIYPLKWQDIINKLSSNTKSLSKYPDIRNFIQADDFEKHAKLNGYVDDKIYINIIPLMLQAGRKLVELCKSYIPNELESDEAKFFLNHFESLPATVEPKIRYPYNKEKYAEDIEKIIQITEEISRIIFNGQSNPYLEEIKYKPFN